MKAGTVIDNIFIGYINTQFTVWCGVCSNWDQISTERKTIAVVHWKSLGWKLTKEYGWVCPNCYKKARK